VSLLTDSEAPRKYATKSDSGRKEIGQEIFREHEGAPRDVGEMQDIVDVSRLSSDLSLKLIEIS
jgi:hypothetical protein